MFRRSLGAVGTFLVNWYFRDTGAKKALVLGLMSVGGWLGLYIAYYFFTSPWKVHKDTEKTTALHWGNGLGGLAAVALVLIAIYQIAVGLSFGVRYVLIPPLIQQWGMTRDGNVLAIADTSPLKEQEGAHRLLLVYRLADYTIDASNDSTIEKSKPFEISGGAIRIESPMSPALLQRIAGSGGGTLELYLLLLPKAVKPEEITTISAIDAVHGQRVGTQTFTVGAALDVPLTSQRPASAMPPTRREQ